MKARKVVVRNRHYMVNMIGALPRFVFSSLFVQAIHFRVKFLDLLFLVVSYAIRHCLSTPAPPYIAKVSSFAGVTLSPHFPIPF